ncbi:MAG: hypothetical protein Q7S02_00895, partial [bacterium]|nr:hypothetical protein [bacterium]
GDFNAGRACTSDTDPFQENCLRTPPNRCIEAEGTVVHAAKANCTPGACTTRISGTSYDGTCVGETSFGNFPDACSATPFTFKHTYRCDGVTDDSWNATVGGCLFRPRVRVVDNWNWCTNNLQGDLNCRDADDSYITFARDVIVR